jgi:peptidoglycan/xylan/chitin deacetylase (PgdA/CDA1 family)
VTRGRAGILLLAAITLGLVVAAPAAGARHQAGASVVYPSYDHARVVSVVTGAGRHVALTFDDCGDATAWRSILSTLRAHDLRATFFCPGTAVRDHVTLARRVRADGDRLCNHGWSHPELTTLSAAAIDHQLRLARNVLYGLTGSRCPYVRPPYGSYDRRVLEIAGQLGYRRAVLWSVDPRDWQRPGAAVIASRVLAATDPGSIVLMHTLPQTAAALPAILRGLRSRRLTVVGLPTLLAIGTPSHGGWPSYSQL